MHFILYNKSKSKLFVFLKYVNICFLMPSKKKYLSAGWLERLAITHKKSPIRIFFLSYKAWCTYVLYNIYVTKQKFNPYYIVPLKGLKKEQYPSPPTYSNYGIQFLIFVHLCKLSSGRCTSTFACSE